MLQVHAQLWSSVTPTDECLAPDNASTVYPSSPGMLLDLALHSPKLQYPLTYSATPSVVDMDKICSMYSYVRHICANCPNNLEATMHCSTCHKIGHFTSFCPKNRYCMYCNSWGHCSYLYTDPHRFCDGTHPCQVPFSHLYLCCPRPFVPDNLWADYDGQYNAYDDIDWDPQDHSL